MNLPGRLNISDTTKAKYIPEPTCQLIDLIFDGKYIENTLKNIGYNQAKTPIGTLSTLTIRHGYLILNELDKLIQQEARHGKLPEKASHACPLIDRAS